MRLLQPRVGDQASGPLELGRSLVTDVLWILGKFLPLHSLGFLEGEQIRLPLSLMFLLHITYDR